MADRDLWGDTSRDGWPQDGWRVRVACAPAERCRCFVQALRNVVGQVEPVFCNIRDDDSVRSVMQGADAVVNCVGIV